MGLEGAYLKVGRARAHLETLNREINTFFEHNSYNIDVQNPADQLYVLRAYDPPMVPSNDWALIIGDCIHNARSALDYIAWELAGSNIGDRTTQFPICESYSCWRRAIDRGRIRDVRPRRARALIRYLQPYRTQDPPDTPLAVLGRLDDRDKHKLLTVTAAVPEHISVQWSQRTDLTWATRFKPDLRIYATEPLTHSAVLATMVFVDAPPDMEMDAKMTPVVVFSQSAGVGTRIKVTSTLNALIAEVEAVLAVCRKESFI